MKTFISPSIFFFF
uniref:Uncharacterized protein n=1 Tax=Anguilla anguilla TaxID=7936 RepID=A0A0E9VHF7_ANGAN